MSHDLDTRGRQAAANLKTAMGDAELKSVAPGTPKPRRPLLAVLRPVVLVVLLAIGSAVGLAVVLDSSPTSTTVPPAPTTTPAPPTTVATEPTPPATVAVEPVPVVPVVPVAPTTTVAAAVEPPPLTITSPEDGATLEKTTVTFAGTTEPGARVFAGKYEAEVDASGNWQIVLIIGEGSTVARFVATDQAGNESHASVTVYYVSPTTTTTIVEKEIAEFSAYATFGSCSETPPFDVYYGTGEPGSLVQVTSEFGSGSVEVGEGGNWEVKVFFEEAPPAEVFLVTVSDEFGRKAKFEFIYTP